MRSFLIVTFLCISIVCFSQGDSTLQFSKAYRWYESNGVCMDSSQNLPLFFSAYEWAGTRYQYGHAEKQKGTDCSGFVSSIYRDVFCIEIARSSAGIWAQIVPMEKKDLQEGDIVFFKIRKGHISHVGVYLGNNKFMHAAVKGGVIISDLDEPYYHRYFYKGGRVIVNR